MSFQRKIEKVRHLGLFLVILKQIIENPGESDENTCRTLADIMIVLEAPEDFLVCSDNIRDFEPICEALKRRFLPIRY
jgi:hypothetical protein